jgi:RNA polymerase sigma-70 factor (ECF subfamily)
MLKPLRAGAVRLPQFIQRVGRWRSWGMLVTATAEDADALASIYHLYGKMLYGVAFGILHDREDAEDCVHDVLVNVWAGKSKYEPERGAPHSFLGTCVRNAALTRKRLAARHREIEAMLATQPYGDDMIDFIAISQVRAALLALPPDQQRPLVLAYYGRRTHAQIARELDLPLGTVKSRLMLGLRKLQKKFSPAE